MDESVEVQVKHATCLQGTKEILKFLVILFTKMENGGVGNSLVVPVLRTPSCQWEHQLIPGQGTKILEAEWHGKKKKGNGGTEVWGRDSPKGGRGGTGGASEGELACLPREHTENFQDSSPCSETSKA